MKHLNTEDAGTNSRGAAINAAIQNAHQRATYSRRQQQEALGASDLLDSAYRYTEMYVNWRKTFISISIRGARARGRVIALQVEELFEGRGYERVETPQATIYRIPREAL
jgi:hypothetical protein